MTIPYPKGKTIQPPSIPASSSGTNTSPSGQTKTVCLHCSTYIAFLYQLIQIGAGLENYGIIPSHIFSLIQHVKQSCLAGTQTPALADSCKNTPTGSSLLFPLPPTIPSSDSPPAGSGSLPEQSMLESESGK